MKITLSKPFAANSAVDAFDVRQIKKTLNRLGYYQPYEATGMTDIPDAGVFKALQAFQKDHGLPATATAKPDDETVKALNAANSKTSSDYYVWRTVGDERVRPNHAAHDWEIRALSDSPDPGEDYGCRCWAEPATQEQIKKKKKQICFDKLPWKDEAKKNLVKHEEDIEHPYIDTAFKITVGIGINIDEKTKFTSLPWQLGKNGTKATKAQIEEAYNKLTRQKTNPANIKTVKENGRETKTFNVLAKTQESWTGFWLSPDERNKLFNDVFDYFYKVLSDKKFSDFNCFSPPAKIALMDMIYNLGETRFSRTKWPSLFKAVNQRDWETAAEQSHRQIPNDQTGRNQHTYDQFTDAADMEENP
jgi:GH24 family phage-related lysozyme (muramidase)